MFRPCKIVVPHSIIFLYNMSRVNNVLYIFYLRKLWIDWRNSIWSMLFLLNKDKLCMLLYFHLLYTPFIVNRIGGVMVSVLDSSTVDRWFEPRSNQRLLNWYLLVFRWACSIKEKEHYICICCVQVAILYKL